MAKKSLEDLLEEVKQELEDTIAVLNSLKTEVPEEVRQDLSFVSQNINEKIEEIAFTQKEKLKKLKQYIEKTSKTLEKLEAQANKIENEYYSLKEDYTKALREIKSLYREILNTIDIVKNSIENYAQNGAKKGIDQGIAENIEKINYALKKLNKTAEEINQKFQTYRWSWIGIILISNFILFLTIIGLGSFLLDKKIFLQYLLEILATLFFLIGAYSTWKLSNLYPKKKIAYSLAIFLLTVAGFTGYFIFKERIVITKQVITKKEVCDLPKPKQTVPQNDGSICYFYDGWYKANGEWHQGQVAICK